MTPQELKKWRKLNGYSQSQLAKVLGVASLTISRWERGARAIPVFLHLTLKCVEKRGGEKVTRATKKGSTKKAEKGKESKRYGKRSV